MKVRCTKFAAAAALLLLTQPSIAETLEARKQADGSELYKHDYGSIILKPDGMLTMTLDNASDALSLDLTGFTIETVNSKPGGIMFVTGPNADGIMMSAYFEAVRDVASAADCRDFYFSYALESPIPKTNIRQAEDGPRAIGAYLVPKAENGMELQQEHRNVYVHAPSHCVDVHLSKVNYDPASDDPRLETVTKSITIMSASN